MSTSTPAKPTIVLIPGAWCHPSLYDPLLERLSHAGYKVHAIDLPSNGDPPSFSQDWQPDVNLISSTVEAYADQGETIILVAHSAGGASSTEAVRGLSVQDRKSSGKPGGIQRLVYIAAFAPDLGVSPLTHEQARAAFYWALTDGDLDYPDPKLVVEIMFNDVAPDEVAKHIPYIQKSAWSARHNASTDVTYAGWKHIPSSYLLCQNDKAVVPEMQEMMIAQDRSRFDDVVRIQAGHCPFISQPEFVEKFVRRAAGERDIVLL